MSAKDLPKKRAVLELAPQPDRACIVVCTWSDARETTAGMEPESPVEQLAEIDAEMGEQMQRAQEQKLAALEQAAEQQAAARHSDPTPVVEAPEYIPHPLLDAAAAAAANARAKSEP